MIPAYQTLHLAVPISLLGKEAFISRAERLVQTKQDFTGTLGGEEVLKGFELELKIIATM